MNERPLERAMRGAIAARPDFNRLARRIRAASVARGIDYDLGRGRRVPINLMSTPAILGAAQVRFLQRLSLAVNAMLRRMPDLFRTDPAVREALPFPADEEAWVRASHTPGTRQPLVTRIDYDVHNAGSGAVTGIVAFEANGVSIGGLYYVAACPKLLEDVVLAAADRRRVRRLGEPCGGAVRLLARHGRARGLARPPRVGILENREWTEGITEMPRLAEALERAGLRAVLGDPRDLARSRGGLALAGQPVDLLYRNMDLRDLADLEIGPRGARLAALRAAFREDRVVSGIAGDFDHKSLWEVLTSERTRHVVPPRWRALFRRHLLWTRLFRETRTEDPAGAMVDLVPWTRRHRARLVLKPNRSCGGDRVTLGPRLDARAWDRAIQTALADDEAWVVQQFHEATCKTFPQARGGRVEQVPAYVCYGVIAIDRDVDVLGRACIRPVVNVAAGGGLMAVFSEAPRH